MEEKFGKRTKRLMLDDVSKKLDAFPDFVITNYKGLSSQKLEGLRKELGKVSSKYLTVKNSIARRAFIGRKCEELEKYVKGEVGIGLIGDIIGASKALADFSKKHSTFKISNAFIDGKMETADRLKQLAMLPPRDVLLAMVLASMKSPITGFVGVLKGLLRNLVYVVSEIKNKKEKNGGNKK